MRPSLLAASAILVLALLAPTSAGASQAIDTTAMPAPIQQSPQAPTPQSSLTVILQAGLQATVSAACGQMVLLLAPKIKADLPFVDTTKLSESACRCTTERFVSDGDLRRVFNMGEADIKAVVNSTNFKQFLIARALGHVLECVGVHVNLQASEAVLTF